MFDVGFTELLLIGIVSLVVIGPERLPAVARTAGQWIGKLQRFVRGVKTDLASELETGDLKKLIGDQREQINELSKMVHSAKKDFESSTRDAMDGAKKSLGEMETSVRDLDVDTTTDSAAEGRQEGSGRTGVGEGESAARQQSDMETGSTGGESGAAPDTLEPMSSATSASAAERRSPEAMERSVSPGSDSTKTGNDSSQQDRTGTGRGD